jgi:hypothetical protein
MKTVPTLVSTVTDVTVEWNADMNRLLVADAATGRRLALFGNDEVYQMMPAVPKGQVIIRNSQELPDIVGALERRGIVKVLARRFDSFTRTELVAAEVLID